jgi:hypothetical protein
VVRGRAPTRRSAAHGVPGRDRRRLRHGGQAGDLRGRRPRREGTRHHREGGGARPHVLGGHAALFQGAPVHRFEDVDGIRKHGIDHYLELVADGRIDLTGMLTHTFALDDWRDAFATIATQDTTGAIKVAFDFRTA